MLPNSGLKYAIILLPDKNEVFFNSIKKKYPNFEKDEKLFKMIVYKKKEVKGAIKNKDEEVKKTLTSSERMIDAPVINLIKIAAWTLLITFLILSFCAISVLGIWVIISIFMNIPEYVGGMLAIICLVSFYIFNGIGFIVLKLLSLIWLCLKSVVIGVSMYIGTITIAFIVILGISLLMIALIKIIMSSKYLSSVLGFKINGFHRARKNPKKR